MGDKNKRSHLWSFIVIGVVLTAYAFGVALNAMNAREADVIYKKDEGVALECVVTWEASGLDELMDKAAEMEAPVTFFMTADFAENHQALVASMLAKGFDIGLLCADMDGLSRDAATLISLGADVSHVMPASNVDSSALEKAASKIGMTTVLCTFELKNTVTDPAELIKKVGDSSFDGAIIRFQPAKTTVKAFSGIIETLRQMGLTLSNLDDGNQE